MKKILPVALTALIACTLILSYLDLLNDRAGADLPAKTYTCFNRSTATAAAGIFKFWEDNALRLRSVNELVSLDYLLIIIYFAALLFILYQLLKANTAAGGLRVVFITGIICLIAGTALDLVQDIKIQSAVASACNQFDSKSGASTYIFSGVSSPFADMRWYTYPKFILLGLAVISVFIGLLAGKKRVPWNIFFQRLRIILSQFFKCIWVFFPGIFFLLLAIAAFWTAGQGKDIIVAFTKNDAQSFISEHVYFNYSRIIFFLAIGFWAYVSWYSSRIIFYIKKMKQEEPVEEIGKAVGLMVKPSGNSYPNIREDFMIEFPRMIGNACFLILELALLQSPMMILSIKSGSAWVLFAELLLAFYFVNRWISTLAERMTFFNRWFNIFGIVFLLTIVVLPFLRPLYFATLFVPVILLHIIYILYTNLHRQAVMEKKALARLEGPEKKEVKAMKKLTQHIMHFFCIPPEESAFYKWFIYTGFFSVTCYLLCVYILKTARVVGPFPFILLAFGVLLAVGNAITAFSVKYKINFHFILFMIAFMTSFFETHYVRQHELGSGVKKMQRPELKKYVNAWLQKNKGNDTIAPIDMYFVMSNGGASRSGFWSAAVLGRLQDATRTGKKKFSDQLFCLSGTSGGGVGVAGFFTVMKNKPNNNDSLYEQSMEACLKQDYFTYTFARLLSYDYFRYIIPLIVAQDRAAKLEESFEQSTVAGNSGLQPIPFNADFSSFPALTEDSLVQYPLLFINTTRVQDGRPGVVSNLVIDSITFNSRIDVIKTLPENCDISMASGAILGARFPYLSPAGRIGDNDFVDGGYFDNSGAGVVQELIRAIVTMGINCRRAHEPLGNLIKRVHFHVLHIVNSPIEYDPSAIQPVKPLNNDLLAPVLTILGAYDMQTTVNDGRLTNYINDLRTYDTIGADYARISLYQSNAEWARDKDLHTTFTKEPPYAMNWFMSDTTAARIIKRLHNNDSLKLVIKRFN